MIDDILQVLMLIGLGMITGFFLVVFYALIIAIAKKGRKNSK